MEFAPQDCEKGGPPGLGSVRGSLDRGVGSEKGGKDREVAVEPGLEREPGWKLWGGGEDQVTQKGDEGLPISQGPVRSGQWWGKNRMRNSNGDGNMI